MNDPRQPGESPESEPTPTAGPQAPDSADTAAPTEAAAAPAQDGGAPEVEPESAVAEAEAKAAEHWNAYLRASAELENVRRRAERDVANAHRYALEKPMSDLLSVVDSLEMGLKSAEGEGANLEAVVEGLRLTLKQLQQALERHGVSRLDPAGEAFNPERHEAVSMVESAEVAPQHVLQVMQAGYLLNDRLLRPAMVIVAKAPAGG